MRELLRELLKHRSAALGLVIVVISIITGLGCQLLAPFPPNEQYRDYAKSPPRTQFEEQAERHELKQKAGSEFVLGTDLLGRDVLSRVLYGARISLLVGLVATLLNVLIGLLVGVLSGYFGGWIDALLMRLTDTFFAFPGILLAIIILATLRQPAVQDILRSISGGIDTGIWGLFVALGLTGWTGIARVIRGQVLALKGLEFVEAARAIGCGHARIVFVHLVPNCVAPLIVLGTIQIAYNILSEAGLSFLGLGVHPPQASWGGMLSEGRQYFGDMPWWGLYPGMALALTVLGFNLFGDGLRDVLDPRMKVRS